MNGHSFALNFTLYFFFKSLFFKLWLDRNLLHDAFKTSCVYFNSFYVESSYCMNGYWMGEYPSPFSFIMPWNTAPSHSYIFSRLHFMLYGISGSRSDACCIFLPYWCIHECHTNWCNRCSLQCNQPSDSRSSCKFKLGLHASKVLFEQLPSG